MLSLSILVIQRLVVVGSDSPVSYIKYSFPFIYLYFLQLSSYLFS